MHKRGIEIILILGFLTGFSIQASVYKCAGKAPETGILYIAATKHSVNFHFTGNWRRRLSDSITRLFVDNLDVIPS